MSTDSMPMRPAKRVIVPMSPGAGELADLPIRQASSRSATSTTSMTDRSPPAKILATHPREVEELQQSTRHFDVLITFSFKHGVTKASVTAATVQQFETTIRQSLDLPETEYDIQLVHGQGALASLSSISFFSLDDEPQLHVSRVKKKTRIAVLGGSFDPITDGHLKMACEIINSRCADEVWIVPCGPRPDKPSLRTPVFHRYIMCHLAVNTTFGARYPVKVCDFEVHEPKALATYHLMDMVKRRYPEHEFFFVIGTDLVESIHEWPAEGVAEAGSKLVAENNFLVVNRPGFDWSGDLPPNFTRLEPAEGDHITLVGEELSSSEVRARLTPRPRAAGPPSTLRRKSGFSNGDEERAAILGGDFMRAEGLVPSAVLAHIIRYNLYQHTDGPQRQSLDPDAELDSVAVYNPSP